MTHDDPVGTWHLVLSWNPTEKSWPDRLRRTPETLIISPSNGELGDQGQVWKEVSH